MKRIIDFFLSLKNNQNPWDNIDLLKRMKAACSGLEQNIEYKIGKYSFILNEDGIPFQTDIDDPMMLISLGKRSYCPGIKRTIDYAMFFSGDHIIHKPLIQKELLTIPEHPEKYDSKRVYSVCFEDFNIFK